MMPKLPSPIFLPTRNLFPTTVSDVPLEVSEEGRGAPPAAAEAGWGPPAWEGIGVLACASMEEEARGGGPPAGTRFGADIFRHKCPKVDQLMLFLLFLPKVCPLYCGKKERDFKVNSGKKKRRKKGSLTEQNLEKVKKKKKKKKEEEEKEKFRVNGSWSKNSEREEKRNEVNFQEKKNQSDSNSACVSKNLIIKND